MRPKFILLTLTGLALLLAAPDASWAQRPRDKSPEVRLSVKTSPKPARPKPGRQFRPGQARPDRDRDKPHFGYPKNDYNYNHNYQPGWRPPYDHRPGNQRPGYNRPGNNQHRPGGPNYYHRQGYNYGYGYSGPAYRYDSYDDRRAAPPQPAEPPSYFGPGTFEPFDDPRFPRR